MIRYQKKGKRSRYRRHKLAIFQNVKTQIFHSFKLLHAKTKVVGNCNSSIFYAARNGKRKRERERPGNENKKEIGLESWIW